MAKTNEFKMWTDNVTDKDYLGFDVHANMLAQIINDDNMLPVTIGLFGDWGSGKSSILKFLKDELESDKETVCIEFNSWTFEGYDDSKAALIEFILKALKDNEKIYEKVSDKIEDLFKSVKWMRVIGWGIKNVAIPAATAVITDGASLAAPLLNWLKDKTSDPKKLVEDIKGFDLDTFTKQFKTERVSDEDGYDYVRKFRKDFSDLLSETKIKRLVVLIDDLDRCLPERIIENLEAIKLFLNVPQTAFVIGADPRIVRHAISYRYQNLVEDKSQDSNSRIVHDYLEKFVQVPYYLPKLSDSEVETYITLLFCESSLSLENFNKVIDAFKEHRQKDRYSVFGGQDVKEIFKDTPNEYKKFDKQITLIGQLSPLITENLYGNPRQIKRFLNTFLLRRQLSKVIGMSRFKDDVLAKLMILEYAQPDLFSELYSWQISNQGIARELTQLEKAKKKSDGKLDVNDQFVGWNQPKIISWINCKPKLAKIDLRDYFWISRDKLVSIQSAQLVPPLVTTLLDEITVEGIPESLKKSMLIEQLGNFNEGYQISFFNQLKSRCINTPSKIENYEIFIAALENGFDCKSYFVDVLMRNGTKTPPSIKENLKSLLEFHTEFEQFVSK